MHTFPANVGLSGLSLTGGTGYTFLLNTPQAAWGVVSSRLRVQAWLASADSNFEAVYVLPNHVLAGAGTLSTRLLVQDNVATTDTQLMLTGRIRSLGSLTRTSRPFVQPGDTLTVTPVKPGSTVVVTSTLYTTLRVHAVRPINDNEADIVIGVEDSGALTTARINTTVNGSGYYVSLSDPGDGFILQCSTANGECRGILCNLVLTSDFSLTSASWRPTVDPRANVCSIDYLKKYGFALRPNRPDASSVLDLTHNNPVSGGGGFYSLAVVSTGTCTLDIRATSAY